MRYTITESRLRGMIQEAVKGALQEMIGNSSEKGYRYDKGYVQGNQGGPLGGNPLDKWHDDEKYEKEKDEQRRQDSMAYYKEWCYNNYDYVMDVCPGYMKSGEYEKAYRCCN